jgi:hypothetical protein
MLYTFEPSRCEDSFTVFVASSEENAKRLMSEFVEHAFAYLESGKTDDHYTNLAWIVEDLLRRDKFIYERYSGEVWTDDFKRNPDRKLILWRYRSHAAVVKYLLKKEVYTRVIDELSPVLFER